VEWIRFEGLERSYGAREIFRNVSGVLREKATVALVGPNGAGKSSLVRILAGVDTPDAGRIVRPRGSRLGYLTQSASADEGTTLRVLLERAFQLIHAEEAHLRELEAALVTAAESGDGDAQDRALEAYGEARERFDLHGGADLERRMRSMLAAFDFSEADLDRSTTDFSGGQRTRASLARLLLEEPDYLILDEPTNHLDIETVRWLEDFLITDPRAALVVSHDRYFLDRVATEVWELDGGALESYVVPRGRAYAAYLEEKELRRELAERAFEKFRDEEKRRQAVVAELRTHGSHNYSHVRSREKQLAKMDRVEAPKSSQTAISVKLDASRRASNGLALRASGLAVAYEQPLFNHLSFDVRRGERIAIVGPNGAGKSTLLDVLAGRRKPDHGHVTLMNGVRAAYFAQDTADDLGAEVTAVEAVQAGSKGVTSQEARSLLGRLGLGGDAGDKPVEAFSGGERRRIMLARLMAQSADLLFLDEPTNDLDIPSREALEAVLTSYGGAMIVVSHDRYLLRRLAERVLWLRDGKARSIDGGYEKFEELQRAGGATDSVAGKGAAAPASSKAAQNGREKNARSKGGSPRAESPNDATPEARSSHDVASNNTAPKGTASNGSASKGASSDEAASKNGSSKNGFSKDRAVNDGRPKDVRRKIERDLAASEREVARLDERRAEVEREFADPAIYEDRAHVDRLQRELDDVREALEAAFARWEELSAAAQETSVAG
jgi:ATP-binding cassette subfamily F protein 3